MKTPLFSQQIAVTAAMAAALLFTVSTAPARTWTEAGSGKQIEAEFGGLEGDAVVLTMAGGRTAKVPLARLSAEDQEFAKSQASASAVAAAPTGGGGGGAEWPQWRGPDQTDISPETGLLKEWPEGGPKQLWVYDDAGMGYSGYSFAGGKLFTMGTRGDDIMVIALDAESGKELWASKIGTDVVEGGGPKGYATKWGHGPRSTPTFADGKLYALGPEGTFACLNAADGKVEWSKDLISDFDGKFGGWGYAESPLVDGEKVVISPGGDKAGIVALNKDTGATIWKAEEVTPGKAEYATLMISEMNGVRQYIRFFEKEVVSVKAEDGSLLWRSEWPGGRTAVIPTPIVVGNRVYVTSGYGAGSKMFEVSPGNEVSDVWVNTEMKNHHGGVVQIDGYVYGFSDGAGLICQKLETGELVWNEKGRGMTKGAVHAADGMLYCVDEQEGIVTLVEASPDGFKSHGQFQLEPQSEKRSPQGRVWTHPVVINGKLYLRDQEYLHCYDVKS